MIKTLSRKLKWAVLHYLRFFARLQLRKIHPIIIGVTGSAGKSSTVSAIAAVLGPSYILKTTKQQNSETGIPLAILDIAMNGYAPADWLKAICLCPLKLLTNWRRYDLFVVELGIDGPEPPKNMAYLLSIVSPTVGVFLNVGEVHLENFDSQATAHHPQDRDLQLKAAIGQEKGRLIANLPPNGCAILNLDDRNVTPTIGQVKGQLITIGFDSAATLCLKQVSPSLTGTVINFTHDSHSYALNIPRAALPKSYGYTFASAIAVGLYFDLAIKTSIKRLETGFTLPNGRFSLLSGVNHSYLLDSSYNASPTPMLESLELLNQLAPGRKIALLGDMNELGQVAGLAHEQVAQTAREICDLVYLVGPLMVRYAYPILGAKSTVCENAKQAAAKIAATTRRDDMILIKGSQNGIFLEAAVAKLLLNSAEATAVLCRQTAFWQNKRQALGLD